MRLFKYLVIFLFCGTFPFYANSSEKIIENLQLKGEPYFIHIVSNGVYDALLKDIENGDKESILGSSILTKWVDASTAIGLKFSLSRAIIKNPDAVLSLIPKFHSASDLCTIPYIEEPIEVEIRHVNESLSALEHSSNPSDARIECINIYQKLQEKIKKMQQDGEKTEAM